MIVRRKSETEYWFSRSDKAFIVIVTEEGLRDVLREEGKTEEEIDDLIKKIGY
jgi:hypothetical protein